MIIIFESNHDDDCEDHAEVWNYGMAAAMDGRASRWEVGYRITSIIFDGDDDGDDPDLILIRHWRDGKKSNREEKEKCRDLFSGSRIFAKKSVWRREGEIINIFASFEMKKRNFAGE